MGVRQVVVLVVFAIGAGVCGLASTLIGWRIVDDVNSRLPEKQQASWFGWHYSKSRRLIEEYRRLYPEGRRVDQQAMLAGASLALAIAVGWLFGFGFTPMLASAILGGGLLWLMFRK